MRWPGLKAEIAKALDVPISEIQEPDKPEQGDFAWPVFSKAKAEGKPLFDVAMETAPKIKVEGIKEARAAGPYVQFFVDWEKFGNELLKSVNERFGTEKKAGKVAVVEYSSPNPVHPFHLGTTRSTVIGEAVSRILESQGWAVKRECYINDLGKQAAVLLTGYQTLAAGKKPEGKPDVWLGKIYFEINKQGGEGSEVERKAFELLKNFESGNREVKRLAKQVLGWCVESFEQDWKNLGIKFDKIFWESSLVEESRHLIRLLENKGIVFDSDGAKILNLEPHGLPNTVFLRRDGTGLYLTRDLPHALWKEKQWKPDLSIYVVSEEQNLHFKQLFKTIELAGYEKLAEACRHLSFSLVMLEGKKMSARRGIQVLWDELLEEGMQKAREEIEKRWPELKEKEKEKRAGQIAIGSIVYYILRYSAEKPVNFIWAEAMRFEGDSGPYLQYTHARARSILEKAKMKKAVKFDAKLLSDQKELAILRLLAKYPQILEKSAQQLRPNVLAEYLHDLADAFNAFYQNIRVLQAESKELKNARLKLVEAAAAVLKSGLALLAVPVPEKL